jgi:hypothetical protein
MFSCSCPSERGYRNAGPPAAAAEQEIFQCLKNTMNRSSFSPIASIWCYQLTLWCIFHSIQNLFLKFRISLEFRVPLRRWQLHLSDSLCIDFDSSALKKSLHSLCFVGFPMSDQAVAFDKSWVKWYSHKLYYEVYHLVVCRIYWYLVHAIIQSLPNSGANVLWAIYLY